MGKKVSVTRLGRGLAKSGPNQYEQDIPVELTPEVPGEWTRDTLVCKHIVRRLKRLLPSTLVNIHARCLLTVVVHSLVDRQGTRLKGPLPQGRAAGCQLSISVTSLVHAPHWILARAFRVVWIFLPSLQLSRIPR